jgi:hypothetical protein
MTDRSSPETEALKISRAVQAAFERGFASGLAQRPNLHAAKEALDCLLFWNRGILKGHGNHHPGDHIEKIKEALRMLGPVTSTEQSPREAALEAAALDFCAKVDRGEARSVSSYAAFKAALGAVTSTDLRKKMEEIHDITQDTMLPAWQALQNIAATASSALSSTDSTQDWQQPLLECRDFIADMIGHHAITEPGPLEHAKQIIANADRALSSTPRTCATCNAVLADGPQPASTYAAVAQAERRVVFNEGLPESDPDRWEPPLSQTDSPDPDLAALDEEIKEMKRGIVSLQERGEK